MVTYVILSKFTPDAFEDPKDFKKLAETVSTKIKEECPDVKWKNSYATMGRYDVVDIVESDNPEQVEKAAMIIHGYGCSKTETLAASPWDKFLDAL
ncbi:MAG: GYD domain-containing protein [Petrotogales bacterium]